MQRMKHGVTPNTVAPNKDAARHVIARAAALFTDDAENLKRPGTTCLRYHAGCVVAWTAFDDLHARLVILGEPRPGAPLCQLFNADLADGSSEGCDVHDFNRNREWQRAFIAGDA